MIDEDMFSVVIPLYNKADHIEACLSSVLSQSFPPKEVIVIDDGSTDTGADLVAGYADTRVKLYHQKNLGPGLARNYGIALSTAEWIAFIDADDLWHRDHLSILVDAISNNPCAKMVGTRLLRSSSARRALRSLSPEYGKSAEINYIATCSRRLLRAELGGEVLTSSTVTVQRELMLAVGGFGARFPGEDTATWLRLALAAPVVATPAITAVYRMETEGIMDQTPDWSLNKIKSHPLRSALRESLANSQYRSQWPALQNYLIAIDTNTLRGAIYNERLDLARTLSTELSREAIIKLGLARHLIALPRVVSLVLVRSYKWFSGSWRRFRS